MCAPTCSSLCDFLLDNTALINVNLYQKNSALWSNSWDCHLRRDVHSHCFYLLSENIWLVPLLICFYNVYENYITSKSEKGFMRSQVTENLSTFNRCEVQEHMHVKYRTTAWLDSKHCKMFHLVLPCLSSCSCLSSWGQSNSLCHTKPK